MSARRPRSGTRTRTYSQIYKQGLGRPRHIFRIAGDTAGIQALGITNTQESSREDTNDNTLLNWRALHQTGNSPDRWSREEFHHDGVSDG